MAINLAAAGLGISLCQGLLAALPVGDGRLVHAFDMPLVQNQLYCLTFAQRSANRPVVATLRDWLAQVCIETVNSHPGFRKLGTGRKSL